MESWSAYWLEIRKGLVSSPLGNSSWSYVAVHRCVNQFHKTKMLLQIDKFWSLGAVMLLALGYENEYWLLHYIKVYFLVKWKLKSKCPLRLSHWSTRVFLPGKKELLINNMYAVCPTTKYKLEVLWKYHGLPIFTQNQKYFIPIHNILQKHLIKCNVSVWRLSGG